MDLDKDESRSTSVKDKNVAELATSLSYIIRCEPFEKCHLAAQAPPLDPKSLYNNPLHDVKNVDLHDVECSRWSRCGARFFYLMSISETDEWTSFQLARVVSNSA